MAVDIIFNSDKTCYLGEYLNGMKHGNGVFTWNDKSKYEG